MSTEFNKEGLFMYLAAAAVILFVVVEALFFIVKAWKQAKTLGIASETLRNTVVSSVLFTIAPSIAILMTVFALSNALGIVLPWIRLSVIGNLAYETAVAEITLGGFGKTLSEEVSDPTVFAAVAWVMMIGNMCSLVLVPLICKKFQSRMDKAVNKSASTKKLSDMISAAAFIGIIAAFVSRAINGVERNDAGEIVAGSAGFMSVCVLVVAVVVAVLLDWLCRKKHLDKLSSFTMPIAMFIAMGAATLLAAVLPESLVNYVWPL